MLWRLPLRANEANRGEATAVSMSGNSMMFSGNSMILSGNSMILSIRCFSGLEVSRDKHSPGTLGPVLTGGEG